MVKVSKKYSELIAVSGRKQFIRSSVALRSGELLRLSGEDFVAGGLSVSGATSQRGSFGTGAAVVGECRMELINHEKRFEPYDFDGAEIRPEVGLLLEQKWDGAQAIEWIPLGVYAIDEAVKTNSTVSIIALDGIAKLERPYTESRLIYPATLGQIVTEACAVCGVPLSNANFPNSGYIVGQKPAEEATTFREVVSSAAELCACFVRMGRAGALSFGWYDWNAAPAPVSGVQSTDVSTADIEVTGVQIIPKDTKAQSFAAGSEGYVLKISGNPLAQENLQALASFLGGRLIGFRFRPYTMEVLSNPALEPGDIVQVTDRNAQVHTSFISNLEYSLYGSSTLTADAETKTQKESTRFTDVDKLGNEVGRVDDKVDENKKETDEAIDSVDGKHTEEERVIRQEFRTADGELVSLIGVTAEGLETEIRQNEAEIELRAKKGELIALINISPEAIVIEAKRLDLHGVVKFSNLEEEGETTINGGNITTGRIQSEDGTFWVDLTNGECYLEKGTFCGEIDWGGGNVLRQSKYGYTELESSKEITISAPRVLIQNLQISDALRVNGDLSVYNGTITADEVHAGNGYSGNVGIARSDGSTRTMRFEDGIFVGYKD